MKTFLLTFLISIALFTNAQILKKGINKDSLFNASIKDLPQELRDSIRKEYVSSSDQGKEFLLFVATMPRSSKELLIKNIDLNYSNIAILRSEYLKLVPPNYIVDIEFEPANTNFGINESINLSITENIKDESNVIQDWNLELNSEKLTSMLNVIHWNRETLKKIKSLLQNAKCISIENREITEIGFARSGLGKYSYLIFNHNLSKEEAKRYNDGCNQIFYKDNIVLEYDGGAAGPQCFPDQNK